MVTLSTRDEEGFGPLGVKDLVESERKSPESALRKVNKLLMFSVSVHGLGRESLELRLAGVDWVCYRDDQL